MFHPGKVIEILSNKDKSVLSSDETTQVVLEMWDENILTFLVDPKLSSKISKNDIVLVDYRPIDDKLNMPRHIVVKILRNKVAQNVWHNYKQHFEKQKLKALSTQQFQQNYMG